MATVYFFNIHRKTENQMQEKIKLEFKTPKAKTAEYNGVEIEVIPFLSMGQQVGLINNYLKDYFGKMEEPLTPVSEYNYLIAEFNLKNAILQTITNLDVEFLNNDFYVDFDFWNTIEAEIANYDEFIDNLDYLVNEVKEQLTLNNSTGKVLAGLLEKVTPLLESIANINPEEIEKARVTGLELMDKLEKNSILTPAPSPTSKSAKPRGAKNK